MGIIGTKPRDNTSQIQSLVSVLKHRLGIGESDVTKVETSIGKIATIAKEIVELGFELDKQLDRELSVLIPAPRADNNLNSLYLDSRQDFLTKIKKLDELTEFHSRAGSESDYDETIRSVLHLLRSFPAVNDELAHYVSESAQSSERKRCLKAIADYKKKYTKLENRISSEIKNFKKQYLSPLGDLQQTLIGELRPNVDKLCPRESIILAHLSILDLQSSYGQKEFFRNLDSIIQCLTTESENADESAYLLSEKIVPEKPKVNSSTNSDPLGRLFFTNLSSFYDQIREQASIVDPYLTSSFMLLISNSQSRRDLEYVLDDFPFNLATQDTQEFKKYYIDDPSRLVAQLQSPVLADLQLEDQLQEFYKTYLTNLSTLVSAKIQARLNARINSQVNNLSINPNLPSGQFTVKYLSNLGTNMIMQDFSEKIIAKAFGDNVQAASPYRDLTQEKINQINLENEKLLAKQRQYVKSLNQEKTIKTISMEEKKNLLKEKFSNYKGTASTLPEIYLEIINKLNAENPELGYPSSLNIFLSQCARQNGRDRAKETQVTTALIQELSSSVPKYDLDELKVETEKYLKEYLKKNSGLDSKSFGIVDYERIYESFTKMDKGSLKARALSLEDFKATYNPDQKFWEELFSVNSFNQAHSEKIQSVIELGKNLSNFDNSILYNILIKTGLAEDKVFNFIDNLKDFTKFDFADQEKFAKDFIEAVGDTVVEKLIANPASVTVIDSTVNDAPPELSSSIPANTPASENKELAIESFGRFTDNLIRLFDDNDQELIQFIENQAVKKIWLNLFKSNPEINSQTDIKEFEIDCNSSAFMQKVYSKFEKEFEQIKNTELPVNYNTENPIKPNLMQRYVAFKLNEIGHFANWSNPGSGKTLSAIYSAMLNEASDTETDGHNILVIGANSTIENEEEWAASISSFDKKAEILNKADYKSPVFKASDRNQAKNNYFLYNYEAFQADRSESLVKALSAKTFDTIILDEVHLIKSADSKRNAQISALIQKAREGNPKLKVLVMSATPIVNNLNEGKEIIKVLTGLDRLDIDTNEVSSKTILDMNRLLMQAGVRFEKAYPQKLEIKKVPIILDLAQSFDRPLIQEIVDSINKEGRNLLDLEQSLSKAKLSTVVANVSPGTIVYSKFVSGIVNKIVAAIQESSGLTVGLYTGENKAGYQAFKNRLAQNEEEKIDVLLASSALGLGANLQDTGDSMIINSLPWSAAEMEQLLGRIYREGSNAEKISVIIPVVCLKDANGEMFSYDEKRLNLIKTKGALADLVLSGEPLRGEFTSEAKLLAQAEKAIGAWQEQIQAGESLDAIQGVQIATNMYPDLKRDFKAGTGLLSPSAVIHNLLSKASSETVGEYYKAHPEEWYLIHQIYDKYEAEWGENNVPRNVLAKKINSIIEKANQKRLDSDRAERVFTIGDFGCGKFELAKQLNQSMTKVYGFDYISADPSNPNIISCDMANIPRKDSIKDGLLDIAVFSLSLHHDSLRERQGSKSFLNIPNYLSEANKLLKARGTLMIALPRHNWSGERFATLISDIGNAGFEIQMTDRGKPVRRIGSDKFMYIFAKKSEKSS